LDILNLPKYKTLAVKDLDSGHYITVKTKNKLSYCMACNTFNSKLSK